MGLTIRGSILGRGKGFYFFQYIQTGSVARLAFYEYLIGTWCFFLVYNCRDVKLTAHLHPVPRFKYIEVGLYLYTVYMP